MSRYTHQYLHSGHQVVTKNAVKVEFVLGLANLMQQTLGSNQQPQMLQMTAEIIENLETTKALLRAAEADADFDEWGVMCPAEMPLMIARHLFIRMYPRMGEILQLMGSSSLMALPTEADLKGPLAGELANYLDTDTATAEDRVRLFRLAWDTCCSAFGSSGRSSTSASSRATPTATWCCSTACTTRSQRRSSCGSFWWGSEGAGPRDRRTVVRPCRFS